MNFKLVFYSVLCIYVLGCSGKKARQEQKPESIVSVGEPQNPAEGKAKNNQLDEFNESETASPPLTVLPPKPTPQTQKINLPNPCDTNTESLQYTLMQVTAPLIGTKYNSKELTDCSGMFHRVLQGLENNCPSFDYPSPTVYRDTRQLARFYHEKDHLKLVYDALEMSELIKPGAVLFFGYKGKNYKKFDAEDLFERGTGINHMGVVIEVTTDEEGVSSYTLFHGLRPGKPAAITAYHVRQPSKKTYPPFGNGKEQWVAVAPIILVE